VSLSLPVGVHSSAKDRLQSCNEQSVIVKKSLTAFMQLWFQNYVMTYLPSFLIQKIAFDVFSRHSLILSNGPGPAKVVMYGPHKLLGLQFFFPNLLPQYDVVSYNGAVFACISVPTDVVTSPGILLNAIFGVCRCDSSDCVSVVYVELLPDLFMEEILELARDFGVSTEEDHMFSPVSSGGVFGIATSS
jgi:hypothetical protein